MAHEPDHLAFDYRLSFDDVVALQMTVHGHDAVAMINLYLSPIARAEGGFDDAAIRRRMHGCSIRRADIDPLVELALAVAQHRVLTLSEAAGNRAQDGPHVGHLGAGLRSIDAGEAAEHGVHAEAGVAGL